MTATVAPRERDLLPAWYGKIPGAGDLVNRRLPATLANWWERWLHEGMLALRRCGPQQIERYYAVAPLWNFLMPAGLGADCVQLGCVAPSCDRVGRYYPVVATLSVSARDYSRVLPHAAGAFYWEIGVALLDAIRHRRAPDYVEHALKQVRLAVSLDERRHREPYGGAARAAALGLPDLSPYFDPSGTTGFWWTHQAIRSPLRTCTHTGDLDDGLFLELFGAPDRAW